MEILERKFLPTQTRSSHAATIAFHNGNPVFSWFGGTTEGAGDVFIHIYDLNKSKEIIKIGDNDNIPRWNPILVPVKDKLFLFTRMGAFCDRWQTLIHDITDWCGEIPNKEILATAKTLPSGLNGPVKTKPIFIGNRMFCGSSVETFYDWTSYVEEYDISKGDICFRERSNPLGVLEKNTYVVFSGVTKRSLGIIQPSLWIDNNEGVF